MLKLINNRWLLLLMAMVAFAVSCDNDDDEPKGAKPVASFQYKIDEENFLKVNFENFSQNAVSYSWNFGDGSAASTEEDPSHTYAAGGTYQVKLTATGADGSTHEKVESVNVTDPNEQLTLLTGTDSKTWSLVREGMALGIGPDAASAGSWFALQNDGSRNCVFDDTFTFHKDGKFVFDDGGTAWGEGGVWDAADAEKCLDGNNRYLTGGKDFSKWGSGEHSFTFDPTAGTLTLTGEGAWMGLVKLGSGEYISAPAQSVTMNARVADGGDTGVDTLVVEWTIQADVAHFWRAVYVSPNEGEIAGEQPAASFTYSVEERTVTLTNTSARATSYSWDYGDGNTSATSDATHSHTYAEDGVYEVVLTAINANGESSVTKSIVIGESVLTLEALIGDGEKVWTLKPVAGAFGVGPERESRAWWPSNDAEAANLPTVRPCLFNDQFIFKADGVYEYNAQDDIWTEGYMGLSEGCKAESELTGDAAIWASGEHEFTLTPATESEPAYITVTGLGAFIALPKAHNGGEYTAAPTTETSVKYEVFKFIDDGTTQTLSIGVDISAAQDGTGWWNFILTSTNN